ncbi:MAG: crossover junction endodeoxyribonuclease RuvC [Vulcanimicrobiaceae bacterium]
MGSTLRILGLDPALRVTGYGAIELRAGRLRLIEAGVLTPAAALPLERRLCELHDALRVVIAATMPDVVVIEELYTTYRNPSTAILMAHARGVLCLACAQAGLPVETLAHSRVKRALVGSGAASKDQVARMVGRLLGLRAPVHPYDVSDALGLALAYANLTEHAIA